MGHLSVRTESLLDLQVCLSKEKNNLSSRIVLFNRGRGQDNRNMKKDSFDF